MSKLPEIPKQIYTRSRVKVEGRAKNCSPVLRISSGLNVRRYRTGQVIIPQGNSIKKVLRPVKTMNIK